jgi:RecB family exonuclease
MKLGQAMKRTPRKRKAAGRVAADEILPEYDFRGALPHKYASRYAAGSTVVVLEPDVAAQFPTAAAANEALRALAGIIQKHRSQRPASRRGV